MEKIIERYNKKINNLKIDCYNEIDNFLNKNIGSRLPMQPFIKSPDTKIGFAHTIGAQRIVNKPDIQSGRLDHPTGGVEIADNVFIGGTYTPSTPEVGDGNIITKNLPVEEQTKPLIEESESESEGNKTIENIVAQYENISKSLNNYLVENLTPLGSNDVVMNPLDTKCSNVDDAFQTYISDMNNFNKLSVKPLTQ